MRNIFVFLACAAMSWPQATAVHCTSGKHALGTHSGHDAPALAHAAGATDEQPTDHDCATLMVCDSVSVLPATVFVTSYLPDTPLQPSSFFASLPAVAGQQVKPPPPRYNS